jgi:hypothetical protein
MATLGCNIVALNAKAIHLVHHNNDREAIKLFLQALSRLKSELSTCHKHSSSPEDGAFLRIPLMANNSNCSNGSKLGAASAPDSCALFDRLLGLCSNVDPCAPKVRDGATALLLYNAGVTEHHMALFQDTHPQQKTLHLKKASQIYNMAFSAAQHWKHYTIEHPGYSILCLAILNNLLSILAASDKSSEKPEQLRMYLRDVLTTAKDTITKEEMSFFAKNLDQLSGNIPSKDSAAVKDSSPSASLVGI